MRGTGEISLDKAISCLRGERGTRLTKYGLVYGVFDGVVVVVLLNLEEEKRRWAVKILRILSGLIKSTQGIRFCQFGIGALYN